jgi:hypothetical protein
MSLTNVGATDGIAVANPMGDTTEAILGVSVLSVDPVASVACGFAVAILVGDITET